MTSQELENWGTREFINCGVEDLREAKSISKMASKLLADPDSSFSSCVGEAHRKSAWRIFSKEEVDISCGHFAQTTLRCSREPIILVHQDTTDLNYSGHLASEGLGDLGGGGGKKGKVILGLCVHSSLATTVEGLPLGLISQKIWTPRGSGKPKSWYATSSIEEKESYRWLEALQDVDTRLRNHSRVIVVSDRESDFYEYIAASRRQATSLLFRVRHLNRSIFLGQEKIKLGNVVFSSSIEVDVFIPKRKDRASRTARLEVSWGEILCPPSYGKKGATFPLSLVIAKKNNPPENQEGIEWYLLTTEKIETAQDALTRIDYYRKRWTISFAATSW